MKDRIKITIYMLLAVSLGILFPYVIVRIAGQNDPEESSIVYEAIEIQEPQVDTSFRFNTSEIETPGTEIVIYTGPELVEPSEFVADITETIEFLDYSEDGTACNILVEGTFSGWVDCGLLINIPGQ
ncbi:hypothetical protein GF357_04015 [Candidatus Dojkabacteria bacterium]|nr:hypothetical protein [Candidatus Dojkabacteria bacterium]